MIPKILEIRDSVFINFILPLDFIDEENKRVAKVTDSEEQQIKFW